jgi:hypothetical protein
VKVLTYSLELAEKREKKLIVELDDWNQKASSEVETSLSGNRSKANLIEEELAILNKKKNNLLMIFFVNIFLSYYNLFEIPIFRIQEKLFPSI